MRSTEFLSETIDIISEKMSVDTLLPQLTQMGLNARKVSGVVIKVTVPRTNRLSTVQDLVQKLPGATASPDGKKVHIDGARIEVKPEEMQHGGRKIEEGQVSELDAAIKVALDGQSDILLTVGGRTVKAAGATKEVEGWKADAVIVDSTGTPTAWISLKNGSTAKDIHGWGGITRAPMVNNQEVTDFVNDIRTKFGTTGVPQGTSFGRAVSDQLLKNQAVFGKEFGGEHRGRSNIDLVLQGSPKVVKDGNNFTLRGNHTWNNGVTPSGDYDPVLLVGYRPDRGNFKIPGARFSLYPAKGRPWTPI